MAVLLFALGWALVSAAARRRVRAAPRGQGGRPPHRGRGERRGRPPRPRAPLQEASLRDEDLRRRESELAARHEGLDTREAELERREAEWREREGPSVADVVTGRAEGNVHEGTASWTDEPGSAGEGAREQRDGAV